MHRAVNDRYLGRNYGGILLVWDRIFGSYEPEGEPCVYGTRGPLRSWNPLRANLHLYAELALDSWRARSWADKLSVWFKNPGWRPADVAARWPKPAFEIARVERYDPPMSRAAQGLALALFLAVLALTTLFLWFAHRLSMSRQLAAAAAICASLWGVGALPEAGGRTSVFSRGSAPRGLQRGPE